MTQPALDAGLIVSILLSSARSYGALLAPLSRQACSSTALTLSATLSACSAGGKESAMGKTNLQGVKHAFQTLMFDLQEKPGRIKDTEFVHDILRLHFGKSSCFSVTF